MFFDTLAGIVERHLPEFVGRMRAAALFRLEKRPPKTVEETVCEWEPDQQTIENFRFPFPNLFLEFAEGRNTPSDRGTLLFVEDMPARRIGFLTGRLDAGGKAMLGAGSFIAFPDLEAGHPLESRYQKIATMKTAVRLWEGDKKNLASLPLQLSVEGERDTTAIDTLYGLAKSRSKEELLQNRAQVVQLLDECKLSIGKLGGQSAYLECIIGVLSLLIINEPASFIVEERPLLPAGEPKHLAVPRSLGRPHYIVLKPRQIRERFIYPDRGVDPEADEAAESLHRRKVGAHERRGHYRRLSAERFKAARGRVIWIDPIWVGPSEAVRGPNRYKVRLDL